MALLIVTVQVKNPEKLKEYIPKVPATMKPFGAKMLASGKKQQVLNGEFTHQIEAVFEFPSVESIENWYASDAYQALIPSREEAAHMNMAVFESF